MRAVWIIYLSGTTSNLSAKSGIVFKPNESGIFGKEVRFQASSGKSLVWFLKDKVQFSHRLENTTPGPVADRSKGLSFSDYQENILFDGGPKARKMGTEIGNDKTLDWSMDFEGANPNQKITGEEKLSSYTNYLLNGNPKIRVPDFGQILYKNVYPEIDLRWYTADDGNLKYDFELHKNGRISDIRIRCKGIKSLKINTAGELEIHTGIGIQKQKPPYSFQQAGGKRKEIEIRFRLINDNTYGFEATTPYDPENELTIDPVIVNWASYWYNLNATNAQIHEGVASGGGMDVNQSGNVFLGCDWRSLGGVYTVIHKFDPGQNGTGQLLWTTVLGPGNVPPGNPSQFLAAGYILTWDDKIKLNPSGNDVFIAGQCNQIDAVIPANVAGFDKTYNGGPRDIYVARIDAATGTQLKYFSYLDGETAAVPNGLEVVDEDRVVVVGNAGSQTFPTTTGALQETYRGGGDGFVSMLNTSVSGNAGLEYSSFLGGTKLDNLWDVEMNSDGDLFISGETQSSQADQFPLSTNAFDKTFGGKQDAFVVRLHPGNNGPADLKYSTYFGGSTSGYSGSEGMETGYSLALAPDGQRAYLTGWTNSNDLPMKGAGTPAIDKALHPSTPQQINEVDIYVVLLNSDGSGFVNATYLGDIDADVPGDLEVNPEGEVYLVGEVVARYPKDQLTPGIFSIPTSPANPGGLPVGSLQPVHRTGYQDLILLKMSAQLDTLHYFTFYGGDGQEFGGLYPPFGGLNSAQMVLKGENGCKQEVYIQYVTYANVTVKGSAGSYLPNGYTTGLFMDQEMYVFKLGGSEALPKPDFSVTMQNCNSFTSTFTFVEPQQGKPATYPGWNRITRWNWEIRDSNGNLIHSATTSNLSFTFPGPGSYSVTLKVGKCEASVTKTVVVSGTGFTPVVSATPLSICMGDSAKMTLSGLNPTDTYTFDWSPALTVSNPKISNPSVRPGATTTYSCRITSSAGCSQTVNQLITLKPTPFVFTGNDLIQCGDTLQLKPTLLNISPPIGCNLANTVCTGQTRIQQVGFSDSVTRNSDPGVYNYGNFGGGKCRMIFTREELNALGISAGVIKSIAFHIPVKSTSNTTRIRDFTLHLGCTQATGFQLQEQFDESVLVRVYGVGANGWQYTNNGWNTYNLNGNGYNWDGVSNLVVQVCWNYAGFVGGTADMNSYTATSHFSVAFVNQTTVNGCTAPTETVSRKRPNIRFGICAAEITPVPVVNYTWTPSEGLSGTLSGTGTPGTIRAFPGTSTMYTLTATNASSGCTSTDSLFIKVAPPFSPVATTDRKDLCWGDTARLNVSGILQDSRILWTPAVGLSNPAIKNPRAISSGSTQFRVSVISPEGCEKSSSITLNGSPFRFSTLDAGKDTSTCQNLIPTPYSIQPILKALPPDRLAPLSCGPATDTCSHPDGPFRIGTSLTRIGYTGYDAEPGPYTGAGNGMKLQMIYRKEELNASGLGAGILKSLAFHVSQAAPNDFPFKNFTIRMACIPDTGFPSGVGGTFLNPSSLIPVYGPQDFYVGGVQGWKEHVFNGNGFNWDGKSNLLIQICWTNCTSGPCGNGFGSDRTTYTATSWNSVLYNLCDGFGCNPDVCPSLSGNTSNWRPDIQFASCPASHPPASITSYLWTPNGENSGIAPGQETNLNVTVDPRVATRYFLKVRAGNCETTDSILINVCPPCRVFLPQDVSICEGDSVLLRGIVQNVRPPVQFLWKTISGDTSLSTNLTSNPQKFIPDDTTRFILEASDLGNCKASDTVQVDVKKNPIPILTVSKDTLCLNETVPIRISNPPVPEGLYAWDFGKGMVESGTGPGPFLVRWPLAGRKEVSVTTNLSGCEREARKTILVLPEVVASAASEPILPDTLLLPDVRVKFINSGNPDLIYHWDFGDGSRSEEFSPVHDFLNPGNYAVTLTVHDAAGCSDTLGLGPLVIRELKIPNLLTLNKDNQNDAFRIEGLNRFDLLVFNRWGHRMYEGKGIREWKPEDLQPGVYFLSIKAENGKNYSSWIIISKD